MRGGKDVDFTQKPAKYQFHAAHKLKNVDFTSFKGKCGFYGNVWRQGCWFHLGNSEMFISSERDVHFTLRH